MKKNTITSAMSLVGLMAAAVILQSCADSNGNGKSIPKASEPIPVKVISLEKSSGSAVITTSGQLTTDDETTLSFKTGGVVSTVLVQEGDVVKKGQLLARLDLSEINALVSQARLGYEKAQRDLSRVTNLFRDSVATREQMENAQTAVDVAHEQYEAAQFNQSFSEIHAPANGVVLRKFVNAGQVVGVGDPVLQTNGGNQGKWILRAGVSDKQWAAIRINDKATVKLDAFPGKTFQASVIRKAGKADPATGAFTIELDVDQHDVKFAAGMFASVQLASGEPATSWSVPYEAVLDASGNDGFVFVSNDSKTALKQPVTIESFNGKAIRISKGLENATALIVSGSAYLTDGSPITILK